MSRKRRNKIRGIEFPLIDLKRRFWKHKQELQLLKTGRTDSRLFSFHNNIKGYMLVVPSESVDVVIRCFLETWFGFKLLDLPLMYYYLFWTKGTKIEADNFAKKLNGGLSAYRRSTDIERSVQRFWNLLEHLS